MKLEGGPKEKGEGKLKNALRKATYGVLAAGTLAGGAMAVKSHIDNLDEQKEIITEIEKVGGISNMTPGSLDKAQTAFLEKYSGSLRQIDRLERSQRLSGLESLANELLSHYSEIIQGLEDENKTEELVKRYRADDWLNMQNVISEIVVYVLANKTGEAELSDVFQRLRNFSKSINSKDVKARSENVRHQAIESALRARGK